MKTGELVTYYLRKSAQICVQILDYKRLDRQLGQAHHLDVQLIVLVELGELVPAVVTRGNDDARPGGAHLLGLGAARRRPAPSMQ